MTSVSAGVWADPRLSDERVWYSITRVSKKSCSLLRSIASDIHGKGFSVVGNNGANPSCAQRRLVMNSAHAPALRPNSPRGIVSRP